MTGGDEPRIEGGPADAGADLPIMDDPAPAAAGPSTGTPRPTVVGLGASAGGVAALRAFFELMPRDAGLAYVVVVHLAPDHESRLDAVLQACTSMPVRQATEDARLEPDHVYVIPPGRKLSGVDAHLRVTPIEPARHDRAPVDHFFRTLARSHDQASVAVVLSGAGSDGALGMRAIKDRGGLTVVQDPDEAEFDGMPTAAVATGMADLVLRIHQMPQAILGFARTISAVGTAPSRGAARDGDLLDEVLAVVRSRTGRDFTVYRRGTLLRRVRRRMQVHGLTRAGPYLDRLREDAAEAEQLADDFLVTVTEFFRDQETFRELEARVVPELFEGKGRSDAVRVWSVGCATGEEAYSLAILLHEHAATVEDPPELQLFATDLHAESLRRAREARYPNTIAASVSPERLAAFFEPEGDWYRVRRRVRDTITFAPHNLFSDAPFSRLDLVVCRNVLIYLDRAIQGDVIDLFHYALRPGGYLLLGPAESIEEPTGYASEDVSLPLFRKLGVGGRRKRAPSFPLVESSSHAAREHARPTGGARVRGLGDLHREMLDELGPPSLLIGPGETVVNLSGEVGGFLTHRGGALTADVFHLVRSELHEELRRALDAAGARREPAQSPPVPMTVDGATADVILRVAPARAPEHDGFALVVFEAREPAPSGTAPRAPETDLERSLRHDLDDARTHLRGARERADRDELEIRAANEQLERVNEELRATVQDLGASKEELQSVNEELITLHEENRYKVEELSQLTSHLSMLMSSADIALVFLDRSLRIVRSTPRAADLVGLRSTEIGRPLAELTHRFGTDADFVGDARGVLEHAEPVQREVGTADGSWYLARTLPYRSQADSVDGVVLTFVDITELKRAQRRSEDATQRLDRHGRDAVDRGGDTDGALRRAVAELVRAARILLQADDRPADDPVAREVRRAVAAAEEHLGGGG